MTKFNYCPMCGEPVSHYDEFCKVCDYALDRKITSERKKQLKHLIESKELYVTLPAPLKEMSNAQIKDTLSFQHMVEADMNTSTDFNPDGKSNYHCH